MWRCIVGLLFPNLWKEPSSLIFRGWDVPFPSQPLKMKAVRYFERPGNTSPSTQCVASQKYESWTKRPWNPQISRNYLVFIICLLVTGIFLFRWRLSDTVWGKTCTVEITGRTCSQSYTAISGPLLWLVRRFGGYDRGVGLDGYIVLCFSLVTEKGGFFLHSVLFSHSGTKTGKRGYL
jgi:hypothetical protein